MKNTIPVLLASMLFACDDPELQSFVLENGSVKAQIECKFIRSLIYAVIYRATKFWDGSVFTSAFAEGEGNGQTNFPSLFHKRETLDAEKALAVSRVDVTADGGCASGSPGNIHIQRRTFYVDDEDLYSQIIGNGVYPCEDTYSPVFEIALSSCEGFNLEAFFN